MKTRPLTEAERTLARWMLENGIEVSGSGDPLKILPSPEQLRPCLNTGKP